MSSNTEKYPDNYLDYIPRISEGLEWEISDDGAVTVFQRNTGLFNHIAQKLLKKPEISQIHLDENGNFIWPLINGENSIEYIAQQVKEHFGEKAEPLYRRLLSYLRTLESYGFIEITAP